MNKHYNTKLTSYNEAEALEQLLKNSLAALRASNDRIEADAEDAWQDYFTITINGIQTAFYLGGPQFEALIAFINQIADENFYEVNVDEETVTA
jgi:hypothetical protein